MSIRAATDADASRGQNALERADLRLAALLPALKAAPPVDAARWVVVDVVRGPTGQAAVFEQGLSNAEFGLSPHNWIPSFAAEVYPVDAGERVLPAGHPAYDQLQTIAAGLGLRTGAAWGDFGHVEVPGWLEEVREVRARVAPSSAVLPFLLLAGVLLVRRSRA